MNVNEARRILTPPLVFGDDRQIRARKFLEDCQICKEAIQTCGDHSGTLRSVAGCECVEGFKDDVIAGAVRLLRGRDD